MSSTAGPGSGTTSSSEEAPDILDTQSYVNAASLQFLLQELVPTSIRVSHKLADTNTLLSLADKDETSTIDKPLSSIPNDLPGTVNVLDLAALDQDDVSLRVEAYGYTLGLKLAELLLYKNTRFAGTGGPGSKIVDILDIMKFVCRDVWKCLYNKQMDNLRTNHRGTFVLVDNNYKLISSLSSPKGIHDTVSKAKVHLWFPCGIIRGILKSFGVDGNVTAEITQFPVVTFNIYTSINN
ncbi:transport protein particle 33 kDa subunit [Suhomyces tanzawaensis NRRL Y-17324]|uniref:Transport protein particle 33 kDa subunit n=1 Tax=Suhomyces tanzawaensis NRRL Y-17324 TaxID=984487 RepID=A0A1E4SRY0_9ASCO|nr:transport protein particle 33 kDa subunit [Suhomyces tanzawaensis NRRL Y-17324]ODV82273.1 transport protein particle 33 kDa subunit [Suhomyces tanzawaensis NRRL Y-17324]